MKKKIMLMIVIIISMFTFTNVVLAESLVVHSGDAGYDTFVSEYNKFPSIQITTDNQPIEIYGYSRCTVAAGCSYSYQGVKNTNLEQLLAQSITCSNGSNKISYSPAASAVTDFKSADYKTDDEVYWREVYTVTCTSDGNVQVEDTSNTGTASTTTRAASGTPSSATGTDNVDTGVETYYVVLFVVAIVSYLLMRVIKKYNLFKSI